MNYLTVPPKNTPNFIQRNKESVRNKTATNKSKAESVKLASRSAILLPQKKPDLTKSVYKSKSAAGKMNGINVSEGGGSAINLNQDGSKMNAGDSSEQEKATRGSRKQMRKPANKPARGKGALYDANGIYIANGKDLCDCLIENCAGCHMPCPKCQSRKCGHECRVNRKWCYDTVEMDGSDVIIKNKNK